MAHCRCTAIWCVSQLIYDQVNVLCLKSLMIKLTLCKVLTARRSKAVFLSRSLPSAVSERTDNYIALLRRRQGSARCMSMSYFGLTGSLKVLPSDQKKWASCLCGLFFFFHSPQHKHFTVSQLKICRRQSVLQHWESRVLVTCFVAARGLFGNGQMTVTGWKGLYSDYWVPPSRGITLFETGPKWVFWVDVENLHE